MILSSEEYADSDGETYHLTDDGGDGCSYYSQLGEAQKAEDQNCIQNDVGSQCDDRKDHRKTNPFAAFGNGHIRLSESHEMIRKCDQPQIASADCDQFAVIGPEPHDGSGYEKCQHRYDTGNRYAHIKTKTQDLGDDPPIPFPPVLGGQDRDDGSQSEEDEKQNKLNLSGQG